MQKYILIAIIIVISSQIWINYTQQIESKIVEKQNFIYTEISTSNEKKFTKQKNRPKQETTKEKEIETEEETLIFSKKEKPNTKSQKIYKKIHGHFIYANKTVGWGIAGYIDQNFKLLDAYSCYIPTTSIRTSETTNDWWLEAYKPFYVFRASDNTIYETSYAKTIKPTPENLDKLIENITFDKKVYSADEAKLAYDNWEMLLIHNDTYNWRNQSIESRAFSAACSSGNLYKDKIAYPNKSTNAQREWACLAMNMIAETSMLKNEVKAHPGKFMQSTNTAKGIVFAGDIYLSKDDKEVHNK